MRNHLRRRTFLPLPSPPPASPTNSSLVVSQGFFLTPGGVCTKLEKRAPVPAGPSGAFHPAYTKVVRPSHSGGPSASWSHGYTKVIPAHTDRPIFHEGPSPTHRVAPTGSSSHRGIWAPASSVTHRPIFGHSTPIVKAVPTGTTHRGASQGNHTGSSTRHGASSTWSPSGVTKVGPGPSQHARLTARTPEPQAEELVFEPEQCAQSQRVCPIGAFGAYEVRSSFVLLERIETDMG